MADSLHAQKVAKIEAKNLLKAKNSSVTVLPGHTYIIHRGKTNKKQNLLSKMSESIKKTIKPTLRKMKLIRGGKTRRTRRVKRKV